MQGLSGEGLKGEGALRQGVPGLRSRYLAPELKLGPLMFIYEQGGGGMGTKQAWHLLL